MADIPGLSEISGSSTPAEKAAIIADSVIDDLPPEVAVVARRCVLLHWFDREIVAALLPRDAAVAASTAYDQIAALPFIERVSQGASYHDLTREGLLARYARAQPEMLIDAASSAAQAYAAREEDDSARAEAFFCYIVAGESKKARGMFSKVVDSFPDPIDWPAALGSFVAVHDEAQGFSFVQSANWPAWYWLGRGAILFASGEKAAALTEIERALALEPENAAVHCGRGIVYADLGEHKRAIADYDRAIELDPQNTTAYRSRGNTYQKMEDYDRALADYGRAIELAPRDASAYYNRGIAYGNLGEHQRAIADYDRAIGLDPEYTRAYNNRGAEYQNLDEYERAIADYRRAIELDPEYASAYYNTACVHSLMGNVSNACAWLKKAIQLNGECLQDARGDPDFDGIRETEEFRELIKE